MRRRARAERLTMSAAWPARPASFEKAVERVPARARLTMSRAHGGPRTAVRRRPPVPTVTTCKQRKPRSGRRACWGVRRGGVRPGEERKRGRRGQSRSGVLICQWRDAARRMGGRRDQRHQEGGRRRRSAGGHHCRQVSVGSCCCGSESQP